MAIFDFFKSLVSYMLPLRLHDVDFVSVVTEKIFDCNRKLYATVNMPYKNTNQTLKTHLNKLSNSKQLHSRTKE